MSRPAFQFYPDNWRNNSNLRRCSWAARGVWVEVICLMHDSDQYGVLTWTMKEIAQALGCPMAVLKELTAKGVMKGCDAGECEPYIYTPRSGRKDGEPVTLVPATQGPIWYSSRMVRDEHVRINAGAATRFGSDQGNKPRAPARESPEGTERAKLRARVLDKTGGACHHCGVVLDGRWEVDHLTPRSKGGRHAFANLVPSCVRCNQDKSDTLPEDWCAPKASPSRRVGEDQSDGSSSSSPPSEEERKSSETTSRAIAAVASHAAMPPPDARTALWTEGLARLCRLTGKPDRSARTLLGQLCRTAADDCALVGSLLHEAEAGRIGDPIPWLQAAIRTRTGERVSAKPTTALGQWAAMMSPPSPAFDFDGQAEEIKH